MPYTTYYYLLLILLTTTYYFIKICPFQFANLRIYIPIKSSASDEKYIEPSYPSDTFTSFSMGYLFPDYFVKNTKGLIKLNPDPSGTKQYINVDQIPTD